MNSPTSSQTRPVDTWEHVTCSSGVSSGGMPEVSADREVDRHENEAVASAAGSDTTQRTNIAAEQTRRYSNREHHTPDYFRPQ